MLEKDFNKLFSDFSDFVVEKSFKIQPIKTADFNIRSQSSPKIPYLTSI